MAAVYASVNTMAEQVTLYTTLQGITLQLLIIRLIRILSAQKRLSILTRTAIKVSLGASCANVLECIYSMSLQFSEWTLQIAS